MEAQAVVMWDSIYQELLAFVYKKVRDKPAAEDIVQDVFIKVHTKSEQIKDADKISGWIYQVTKNAVADYFRRNAKSIAPVDVNWDSHNYEFNDCVASCLKVLMSTLPEKYRVPLELTELENLTQHELAGRLKISHSGARSRVQRARKMLKTKLDELYLIKTDTYGNVIVCEDRNPNCCQRDC